MLRRVLQFIVFGSKTEAFENIMPAGWAVKPLLGFKFTYDG